MNLGDIHFRGRNRGEVNVLVRTGPSAEVACVEPLPPPTAGPVPLWPPVPFSPLTGSDGYNPFLTTGEILGSGPDSDPAGAPGQTFCHGQETLTFHSCLALGFPSAGLGLLTLSGSPRLTRGDRPHVTSELD